MKKKKITPQDLELNIEVIGGKHISPKFTETRTCPQTKNNCTDATFDEPEICDTTTTDPTQYNCLSVNAEDCKPTKGCPLTIEPACETKVGCYDSHSNAQLCCPVTEQTGCRETVDNCVTVDICGPNTLNICLETSKDCLESMECRVSHEEQATCTCMLSEEDNSCKPMEPNTFVTTC